MTTSGRRPSALGGLESDRAHFSVLVNFRPAMTGLVDAYFLPGGWVKGEVPTDTAGFGFSALGLRTSLFDFT